MLRTIAALVYVNSVAHYNKLDTLIAVSRPPMLKVSDIVGNVTTYSTIIYRARKVLRDQADVIIHFNGDQK